MAVLLCLCVTSLRLPAYAAIQAGEARELVPDTPIDRELRGSEVHIYEMTLAAGAYLRLLITPRDISVQAQVFAPGRSENIAIPFSPLGNAVRVVSLVAEFSGRYRLEIRLEEESANAGTYQVKIEALRQATETDKIRVAAERAEGEGIRISYGTGERTRPAIAKFEEALGLWRTLGERKAELRLLISLNLRFRKMGEQQTALEYARQAIQLARTLGDRYQEANLTVAFGIHYRVIGEYQKALDSFHEARQIFKNLSAGYGEALAILQIALTLNRLGDWSSALQYFETSLPIFASVGDRRQQAFALHAMGSIHRTLGDKQKAIELHNRALEGANGSELTDIKAYSLTLLSGDYLALGDHKKAIEFSEQAVSLFRALGEHLGEADGLKLTGNITYFLGDYQKALDFLRKALVLYRSLSERSREATVLHDLAQVNFALGNLDEARKQIEQALEIQESLRVRIISEQLRENIFTWAQSSFGLYIDLLMESHKRNPGAGNDAAALQASERARVRSLLDLLSESHADIRQGVSPNLLELERSLRQKISDKAAARTALLNKKGSQAQAELFDREIADLNSRHRDVEVQIRQSSPRYAALTQPQPLTANQIQQQLDDETVLLEFVLGEKHSWLWAVTRTSIESYQLPPSNEIESFARKVYELLTARQHKKGESEEQSRTRIADADAKFETESATLSQKLLGQIAPKLKREWKDKRLAIVASGALEYIPFAALPLPKSEDEHKSEKPEPEGPLIAQHEIVNLPSASALATIRTETGGRKRAEKNIAVIADPVFEASDPRVLNALKKTSSAVISTLRSSEDRSPSSGSQTFPEQDSDLARSSRSFNFINQRGGFQRLPFSREEADAIASLTATDSLMEATDFQANRKNATSGELANYRIVHFATHGLINGENPELSGLVLSLVDEAGRPQDGFLRMQEIYNLQMPADLIVLSACQTALGKEIKGEGLVGLTRGFMYAGAQRVVASLWQVDDLATAELMKRFYRGMLKDGLRPSHALRIAQLEMFKQKRWSSPFFWAPFFIQGEWR